MTKGFTYTATDSKGTVHTRYSAGHRKPMYVAAVVRRPGNPQKDNVSYAGRHDLARKALNVVKGFRVNRWHVAEKEAGAKDGDVLFPDAEIVTVTFRVGK